MTTTSEHSIDRQAINLFANQLTVLIFTQDSGFAKKYAKANNIEFCCVDSVKHTVREAFTSRTYEGETLRLAVKSFRAREQRKPELMTDQQEWFNGAYRDLQRFWQEAPTDTKSKVLAQIEKRFTAPNRSAPNRDWDDFSDDEQELFGSAQNGNLDTINFRLDRNLDVNTRDRTGRTALYFAAGNGRDDAVQLLIARGATTGANEYDRLGHNPLHACYYWFCNRSINMVGLLSQYFDINAINGNGETALQMAVSRELPDHVKAIIKLGANTFDIKSGLTYVEYAIQKQKFNAAAVMMTDAELVDAISSTTNEDAIKAYGAALVTRLATMPIKLVAQLRLIEDPKVRLAIMAMDVVVTASTQNIQPRERTRITPTL